MPDIGAAGTCRAIEAVQVTQCAWCETSARDCAKVLCKLANLTIEHQQDLAAIPTAEQDKSPPEAAGEIAYTTSFIEWFAEEARHIYGDTIPLPWDDHHVVA